jgi:hypothetical protein
MTPAEFKTRFPEFTSETDQRVQLFIDDAASFFDVERWDDLYEVGVAYFVAHELAQANAATAAGGQAGAGDDLTTKVGDVSVTRDTTLLNKQANDPFMKTAYGQKYKSYARLVGTGGVAV